MNYIKKRFFFLLLFSVFNVISVFAAEHEQNYKPEEGGVVALQGKYADEAKVEFTVASEYRLFKPEIQRRYLESRQAGCRWYAAG